MIIATGPLTSPALAAPCGSEAVKMPSRSSMPSRQLSSATSIDMSIAWFQSRYDKEGPGGTGADYINCPLTRDQYETFVDALLAGEKTAVSRVGGGALFRWLSTDRGDGRARARDPPARTDEARRPDRSASPEKPYAVVQLRQDNQLGTLFNIVGFQTKLKHGDQLASSARSRHSPTRSSRGLAVFIATPFSIRQSCWMPRCASNPSRASLCRSDYRLRRLR